MIAALDPGSVWLGGLVCSLGLLAVLAFFVPSGARLDVVGPGIPIAAAIACLAGLVVWLVNG